MWRLLLGTLVILLLAGSAIAGDSNDNPNTQGGAGTGTTVHGCLSDGTCNNNGPTSPPDPPTHCHVENGIQICD